MRAFILEFLKDIIIGFITILVLFIVAGMFGFMEFMVEAPDRGFLYPFNREIVMEHVG
ncbi:MAG: hypothetical protein Q8P88_00850 [Candidatus Jorgensenbacteria bacterium]|nr:hypothetical protein [Candidatus Jorgensenbacteria bacterium]